MTLKRKASFSSPSPNRDSPSMLPGGVIPMVDESSRHLHSRTRKRFRNDRPDDQTVYDNTLRWLFSAQQNPAAFTPSVEESDPETPLTSTTIDPSQQSLRKFFQPSSANTRPLNGGNGPSPFHNQPAHARALPRQADDMDCTDDTSASGSGYGATMDVDMDMDMDMNASCGHPTERRWVGGIGWI
ncbi:hypothetical protein FQN54_003841 [Arachnomyces sp. PD_36]|nr:hypothetical protein FQN54_003841 [Arachnomyces sp. PD_36]